MMNGRFTPCTAMCLDRVGTENICHPFTEVRLRKIPNIIETVSYVPDPRLLFLRSAGRLDFFHVRFISFILGNMYCCFLILWGTNQATYLRMSRKLSKLGMWETITWYYSFSIQEEWLVFHKIRIRRSCNTLGIGIVQAWCVYTWVLRT